MFKIFRMNPEYKGEGPKRAIGKPGDKSKEDDYYLDSLKMEAVNEYKKMENSIPLTVDQFAKYFILTKKFEHTPDKGSYSDTAYNKEKVKLENKSEEELKSILDKKNFNYFFYNPSYTLAFLAVFRRKVLKRTEKKEL